MTTTNKPKLRRLHLTVDVPIKGEFIGDAGFKDYGCSLDSDKLREAIDGDEEAKINVAAAIDTLFAYHLIGEVATMRRRR